MHKGTVKRLNCKGQTATMSRGSSRDSYQEPLFRAVVYDDLGQYVADVGNGTTLCLPGGSVRAAQATDQQILDAVLGDESIF